MVFWTVRPRQRSSDPETERGDQDDAEEEEDDDSTDTDEAGEDSDEELGPAAEIGAHRDETADAESDTERGRRDPKAAAAAKPAKKAEKPRRRPETGQTQDAATESGSWGSGLGLRNVGNTCYMNAVLQGWIACGDAGRRVAEETEPQATEIRQRTQELVRCMRRTPGALGEPRPTYISPREFWRALRNVCPEFDNTRQHDAPAFFLSLRRALARVPGDHEPSPAWAACLAEPELHVTESITCEAPACRRTTDNRPLPGQPAQDPERVIMTQLREGAAYPSVMEAIGSWTGPEGLPAWRCEKCGSLGGTRVRKCRTLPHVLVVWLQRFRGNPGAGARRVATAVEHLDQDLDLSAHLDGTAGQPTPENRARYRTRAIVCHHGTTLAGGHYTCWVRAAPGATAAAADTWVQYNDSIVGRPRGTLPPNVPSDAVLLFYEQLRPEAAERPRPAGTDIELDDTAAPDGGFPENGAAPGAVEIEDEEGGDVPMSDGESGTVKTTGAGKGEDEDDPMDTS